MKNAMMKNKIKGMGVPMMCLIDSEHIFISHFIIFEVSL